MSKWIKNIKLWYDKNKILRLQSHLKYQLKMEYFAFLPEGQTVIEKHKNGDCYVYVPDENGQLFFDAAFNCYGEKMNISFSTNLP